MLALHCRLKELQWLSEADQQTLSSKGQLSLKDCGSDARLTGQITDVHVKNPWIAGEQAAVKLIEPKCARIGVGIGRAGWCVVGARWIRVDNLNRLIHGRRQTSVKCSGA
jgi:hypothetical protein